MLKARIEKWHKRPIEGFVYVNAHRRCCSRTQKGPRRNFEMHDIIGWRSTIKPSFLGYERNPHTHRGPRVYTTPSTIKAFSWFTIVNSRRHNLIQPQLLCFYIINSISASTNSIMSLFSGIETSGGSHIK